MIEVSMKHIFFITIHMILNGECLENVMRTDPIFVDEWNAYKIQYNFKFEDSEDIVRARIFSKNLLYIEDFNNQKKKQFQLKMNRFGHLSDEEFLKTLTCKNNNSTIKIWIKNTRNIIPSVGIDYRNKGAVTEVKDQGKCHCSWAFSAAGALEAQYFFMRKLHRTFSPQELVDCSNKEGNQGCSGGVPSHAFQYVQNHGLRFDDEYPYKETSFDCPKGSTESLKLKIAKIREVPYRSEFILQLYLVSYGPLSVVVDASDKSFRFYSSGIYSSPFCSSVDLNHALLLVGMKYPFNGYYILKNSWGTDWGIDGYMHLAKNKRNMCGVASQASVPIIAPCEDKKSHFFKD